MKHMEMFIQEHPQYMLLFFVGFWAFICFLVSRIGGWSKLASQYPCETKFTGTKFRFKSIKMGWVSYGNCVDLGVNASEFYLSPMILFRVGHKPIKVPLSNVKGRLRKGLFLDSVVLSIIDVNIKVSKRLADSMASASEGNWHYRDA